MKRIVTSALIVLSSLFTASPAFASHSLHEIQNRPVPEESQYKTFGPGISYPDSTDPTRTLPRIDQIAFQCIRRYESRNHLVDGTGNFGWYQFDLTTWNAGAVALGFPPRLWWNPDLATGDQQSAVAVWYFKRNGRFGQQWGADSSSCPGVFYFT